MKMIHIVGLVMAMGMVAGSQTAQPQKKAAKQAPDAAQQKSSAPAKSKKTSTPAKNTKTPAASKPVKAKKPKAAVKKSGAATAATAVATESAGAHGRRDPFVNILHPTGGEGSGGGPPPCASGKRCLAVPEIVLQGIVKDTNGAMMALVLNQSRRMYMLYENDQIYNGTVVKITADSVTFRETATDKLGRPISREVIKRMQPSS